MPKQLFLGGEIGRSAELFERDCVVPIIYNVGLHGESRNSHVLIKSPQERVLCGAAFCGRNDWIRIDQKRKYPTKFRRLSLAWQMIRCQRCLVAIKHRYHGVLPPFQIRHDSLSDAGNRLMDSFSDTLIRMDRHAMRKSMATNPVPWLVFADWLDEQGNSRGELIRILVEACQRKLTDPVTHYVSLVTRAWELFQELQMTGD